MNQRAYRNGATFGKEIYLACNLKKSQLLITGLEELRLSFRLFLETANLLRNLTGILINAGSLLREPLKVKEQIRNFNDHFFDSITAGSMKCGRCV